MSEETLTKRIISPLTSVVPGDNITYEITLTNNTGATLTDRNILEEIQPGTTFVSLKQLSNIILDPVFTPAVGTPGTVVIRFALPAHQTAIFQVVAKVDPSTPAGTVITNFVREEKRNPDLIATTSIVIADPVADLSVLTEQTNTTPNQPPTYLTTLTNNGSSDAHNVVLTQIVKIDDLTLKKKNDKFSDNKLSCDKSLGDKSSGDKFSTPLKHCKSKKCPKELKKRKKLKHEESKRRDDNCKKDVLFTQLTGIIPNSPLTPTSDLQFNLSPLALLKSSLLPTLFSLPFSIRSVLLPSSISSLIETTTISTTTPVNVSNKADHKEILFVATIPVFPAGAVATFETVLSKAEKQVTVSTRVASTTSDPDPNNNVSCITSKLVKNEKKVKKNKNKNSSEKNKSKDKNKNSSEKNKSKDKNKNSSEKNKSKDKNNSSEKNKNKDKNNGSEKEN